MIILWIMILVFTLYFSAYTIRRFETLNAYTADLSLIDQAMWNTLHGRFLEATWGDHQQPRLAEHFEPILVPLAALFWLWDDVRILLVAQSFALAIGALPLYWLAKAQLRMKNEKFIALIFPLLYLLAPPLQAAAVADFHADPFVVAPLLFAFWYATQNRWRRMWFWAIVMMLVKENMPTLVVMLGGYLVIGHWPFGTQKRIANSGRQSGLLHGIGLAIIGTAWFGIATFGIVAPLAKVHFATDAPIYLASRFSVNPIDWLHLLRELPRLRYLLGLLATTGGLALFAPQYLLLGLPIFIANTFSNFPGQYSGEQHYSAPLVAVLMITAIYGTKNLFQVSSSKFKVRRSWVVVHGLLLAALIFAFGYQIRFGWTPFSRRTEVYAVTAHTQTLPRLLAQVPAGVPVSASAAVHPHLAHRPVAYTFPTIEDAEFILADVTDVPGKHPNDVRAKLNDLLISGDWRLLDAVNGFILLKNSPGSGPQTLPDEFYDFARAPNAKPQHPLNLTFGDSIRLFGFDVIDKPFHRQTSLRLYWEALRPDLPVDLTLWPQFYDDSGLPLTDPQLQPAIETVWYPPAEWKAGETIATQTLPQNLGRRFHLGVFALRGTNPADFGSRLAVAGATRSHDQQTWATVAGFERGDWVLETMPPTVPLESLSAVDYAFENGLSLTGFRLASPHSSDQPLTLTLAWYTKQSLLVDYTIFLHLLDDAGNIVAQADSQPHWLTPYPSSRWQTGETILDSHTIAAPLPPGTYRLRLGVYNWQTFERLPLTSGEDSLIVGEVTIGN